MPVLRCSSQEKPEPAEKREKPAAKEKAAKVWNTIRHIDGNTLH